MKPRILVTSAAGRTGSVAVLELLGKGFPVRAFVRRNEVRSSRACRSLKAKYIEPLNPDPFDMTALYVIVRRQ